MIDRLRKRLAIRRRNRVIDGLLTSTYWQARTGLFDVVLERRAGETEEAHASRELVAANEHVRSALLTIGLMVRNELDARGLLGEVEQGDEPDAVRTARQFVSVAAPTQTATLKRTIPGRPE